MVKLKKVARENGNIKTNVARLQLIRFFMVFRDAESLTVTPTEEEVAGFNRYLEAYRKGLALEHCALENI